MTYISTGRTWLELQWQHVRGTEPSEGSADGMTWGAVPLYIPEIAHTLGHIFGQDDEVCKARAGSGKRSTTCRQRERPHYMKLLIWLCGQKCNPKTSLAIWYMTDCLSSFVKTSEMRECRSTQLKPQHLWGWGRSISGPRPDWATYCISTGL